MCGDAFIVKLDATPSVLWATYLGGTDADELRALKVDDVGRVYVGGATSSTNFPRVDAIAPARARREAFASVIAADGAKLLFSTTLGGSNDDEVNALTVDANGLVYLTGSTASTDFPVVAPYQSTKKPGDNGDAFVAKISVFGATPTPTARRRAVTK